MNIQAYLEYKMEKTAGIRNFFRNVTGRNLREIVEKRQMLEKALRKEKEYFNLMWERRPPELWYRRASIKRTKDHENKLKVMQNLEGNAIKAKNRDRLITGGIVTVPMAGALKMYSSRK